MSELSPSKNAEPKRILEPFKVIDNFVYNPHAGIYTPPFATEYESHDALLTGSEGAVLCSKGDPIVSKDFVQCGCALVRNKQTGLITLIHQSMWSAAASLALYVQRKNDLDVLIMSGAAGHMRYETVRWAHEKQRESWSTQEDEVEKPSYFLDKQHPLTYKMGDYSVIKGLSPQEISEKTQDNEASDQAGTTTLLGAIEVPGPASRWSLAYRPQENVIMIHATATKQLLFYEGFPAMNLPPQRATSRNPLSAIIRLFAANLGKGK